MLGRAALLAVLDGAQHQAVEPVELVEGREPEEAQAGEEVVELVLDGRAREQPAPLGAQREGRLGLRG